MQSTRLRTCVALSFVTRPLDSAADEGRFVRADGPREGPLGIGAVRLLPSLQPLQGADEVREEGHSDPIEAVVVLR